MSFPFGEAINCTILTCRDEKRILGLPPDGSQSSFPPLAKVSGIPGTIGVHETSNYIAIPERSSENVCDSIKVLITRGADGHVAGESGEKGGGLAEHILGRNETDIRCTNPSPPAAHLQEFHCFRTKHQSAKFLSCTLNFISSIKRTLSSWLIRMYLPLIHSLSNRHKLEATVGL